ncbi:SUN domain-containing protein 2-like isoform X2 [Centropristis striata]|uniref:SUN domain-containing protein 2-like isoform X2 n=1 Tax=Centropristis striata TaxID=184440 RepID=UPI0027DF0348|nr:SUN domain-containing protein 2-like isoform X2 [Centropristis striata]
MSRRSSRLDLSGYYNNEGEPVIRYRESRQRNIKRRRTTFQSWRRRLLDTADGESECGSCNKRQHDNSRTFMTIVSLLSFIVSLCLGFAFALQQEKLQECENRLKYLQPVADTMPNFALETQGAFILPSLSTATYQPPSCVTYLGISLWQPLRSPRIVIQGHPLRVGDCWPLPGDHGHLFIALSHPVTISHVTLGHISKNVSPSGSIYSAPKEFSVFGMKTLDDEGTQLGTFLYDHDGDQVQTFKLPDHKKGTFNYVKLQVESNWGHPDYTCLYNFRVHGMLQTGEGKQGEKIKLSSGCRDW